MVALVLIVTLLPGIFAQSPTITATTDLVIVPALVRQPSGGLVQPLAASDFILTDNGVPQSITLDGSERQPLSILSSCRLVRRRHASFPIMPKLGRCSAT